MKKFLMMQLMVLVAAILMIACDNENATNNVADGDADQPVVNYVGPGRPGRLIEVSHDIVRGRGVSTIGGNTKVTKFKDADGDEDAAEVAEEEPSAEPEAFSVDFEGIEPNFSAMSVATAPFWPVGGGSCFTGKIYSLAPNGAKEIFYEIPAEVNCVGGGILKNFSLNGQEYSEWVGNSHDTVLDPEGNTYYASPRYDKLIKIATDGTVSYPIEGQPCMNSLAINGEAVYISVTNVDGAQAKVIKLGFDDSVSDYATLPESVIFPTGTGGEHCQWGAIFDITFDAEGNLYATNNVLDEIYKISADLEFSIFAENMNGVSGLVYNPHNGYLYATTVLRFGDTDTPPESAAIYAISLTGDKLLFYPMPLVDTTWGITSNTKPLTSIQLDIDASENLYVLDAGTHELIGLEIIYTPECDPAAENPCAEGEFCLPSATSALGGYCLTNCWLDGAPDTSVCNVKEICQPYGAGPDGGYCAYPCSTDSHCAAGEYCTDETYVYGAGLCITGESPDDDDDSTGDDDDSGE